MAERGTTVNETDGGKEQTSGKSNTQFIFRMNSRKTNKFLFHMFILLILNFTPTCKYNLFTLEIGSLSIQTIARHKLDVSCNAHR